MYLKFSIFYDTVFFLSMYISSHILRYLRAFVVACALCPLFMCVSTNYCVGSHIITSIYAENSPWCKQYLFSLSLTLAVHLFVYFSLCELCPSPGHQVHHINIILRCLWSSFFFCLHLIYPLQVNNISFLDRKLCSIVRRWVCRFWFYIRHCIK